MYLAWSNIRLRNILSKLLLTLYAYIYYNFMEYLPIQIPRQYCQSASVPA